MKKIFSYFIARNSPFLYLAVIAGLIASFLLRNINNWDYPLAGEFYTTPFYSEIMIRSLSAWDEHFGLGFSNLLNSPGQALYANVYSGAMWVSSNILNALFQWTGATYFFHQAIGTFLFGISIYLTFTYFQPSRWGKFITLALTTVIILTIQSTDFFIGMSEWANRFLAGQGLLLIAFLQYRRLSRLGFKNVYSVNSLLPLTFTLATLILVFSSYFIAFAIFIGIQAGIQYVWLGFKRRKVQIHYIRILFILGILPVLIYGYVIAPPFFAGGGLISGAVGRHDNPMSYQLIDLLRFFNNPLTEHFSWVGAWWQFLLVFFGIILSLISYKMRRWAIIDLLSVCIILFLAKGSAIPLPEVNHWLHANIPFLRLMGSGYPYIGVVYTIFIYYLIYGVIQSLHFGNKFFPKTVLYVGFLIATIILLVAIFRNDSYLSGDFGGRVQSIEYPTEYYSFKKIAEKEMRKGRAYYFPDEGVNIGLDYKFSPTHAYRQMGCCWSLPFSSVFPIGIYWSNFTKYNGYYGPTMAYLIKHYEGINELVWIFLNTDTRYAVFDLSIKNSSPAADRMLAIRNQVQSSKSFKFQPKLSNQYIEVYENMHWKSIDLLPKNLILSSDDPAIFLEAARKSMGDFYTNIIVSGATTFSSVLKLIEDKVINRIFLYNSDLMGLMLDLMRAEHEIKPDPNSLSTSRLSSWYTYQKVYQIQDTERYGGRFIGRYPVASTSNEAMLIYKINTEPNIKSRLFVRAMVSPNSARVLVQVNNETKSIELQSVGYVGFQWFDLGDIVGANKDTRILFESLGQEYLNRIDIVMVVPEEKLITSKLKMQQAISSVSIDRLDQKDYLLWKMNQKEEKFGPIKTKPKIFLEPKNLLILSPYFSITEDFDTLDKPSRFNKYNLNGLEYQKNILSIGSVDEKRFMLSHGGMFQNFIATPDLSPGRYSLKYELVSCQEFTNLTMVLNTQYVTQERPLNIYVSDDAKSWSLFSKRISDEQANNILDLSKFVKDKKKIYLKISHDKFDNKTGSINLLNLKLRGSTKEEGAACMAASFEKSKLWPYIASTKANLGSKDNEGTISVINNAYDPNWRMDNLRPFNIGLGFSAFLTGDDKITTFYYYDWTYKYRGLLYFSAGVYLFLCLTLCWRSFQRKRLRRLRIRFVSKKVK